MTPKNKFLSFVSIFRRKSDKERQKNKAAGRTRNMKEKIDNYQTNDNNQINDINQTNDFNETTVITKRNG